MITINNIPAHFQKGETILDVAKRLQIHIPTLCHHNDHEPEATCMVCVVKDKKNGKLLPSCEFKAQDGMEIITNDETVITARKTALELLLSDHVGDCYAPCQNICPAGMDIPQMNRLIAKGKYADALKVVKKTIPLPVTLGYICPAPCEKGCRRKQADESVGICILKRFVGEKDLNSSTPYLPVKEEVKGKKISIIGAGPAGLSAAWYLLQLGYSVEIFEKEAFAGGEIIANVSNDKMPHDVFFKEVALIEKYGARFHYGVSVDSDVFADHLTNFDAILLATGSLMYLAPFGIECNKNGVVVQNYQSSEQKVFATGACVRNLKMAVQAVAQGKEAAQQIDIYLDQQKDAQKKPFNSSFGKLSQAEVIEYLKEASPNQAIERKNNWLESLSEHEVRNEATRCMHCDCRAAGDCTLQTLATEYNAKQARFKANDRNTIQKHWQHSMVVYEPEKCIKCGICIKITRKYQEKFGFTFIGRGFDVRVQTPFSTDLSTALCNTAEEVAKACPTGSICLK